MTSTITQDDLIRATAALAAIGAAQLGPEAVQRLARAFAEARATDRSSSRPHLASLQLPP